MPSVEDLADWIDSAARTRPQNVFVRTPLGRTLTYSALLDRTGRYAAALAARGVRCGDRVAAQVEKSVEAVVLYLACLRFGAVFVPINVANTAHEVDYFLRDSEPHLAILSPAARTVLEPLARRSGVREIDTLGVDGDGSLPELAGRCAADSFTPRSGDADAPAAIVYTSGTTGRSKGAVLTRRNLASNAAVLADVWRFTERDVLVHTLPLFHVHGLFAAINTVLVSASSLVLLPKFAAAAVIEQFSRATVYMGVPTHYTRLLQEPGLDSGSAAHMRLFVSGSAPLLAETHRQFFQRTSHGIVERYGMTETLMNTSNPYGGPRIAGSVGLPLPGVSVRVARAAQRDLGALDDIGGLEVTGPNVFAGYWRDEEKTRGEFTPDGWFKTGDLGRIDGDGYVFIVGRAKDLVISGGYNVYPKEVEMQLDDVPGVVESAVFGVPHPDFGEGVTAAVVAVASLSEAQVLSAIRTQLAGYKIPKRIVFVDELPRNALGKVQKNLLRTKYAALYGAA